MLICYACALGGGSDCPELCESSGPLDVSSLLVLELSLGLWGLAGDLEAGVWTGPHEERGRWLLVRRLPEDPAAPLALEHYALEIFEVSFVPAEADLAEVEAIMDSSELVLLDPSWRETVPARWRYRMNASPGETE